MIAIVSSFYWVNVLLRHSEIYNETYTFILITQDHDTKEGSFFDSRAEEGEC